jgi:hypothetical protein
MTVVSDFTVIQDSAVTIGDAKPEDFQGKFRTTNNQDAQKALITMMVSGLAGGSSTVRLNGHKIGEIAPHDAGSSNEWFAEQFAVNNKILKPGQANPNTLEIKLVPAANPAPGNAFDDFQVRDIVCFFHQDV